MRDDPYFGRETLVGREARLQAEPMGGYVHGKYDHVLWGAWDWIEA